MAVKSRVSGFTVFELIFIIAFLAVAAAGVIFYIDPFEKAKIEKDTNLVSAANMILSAINSFYISNGRMPWVVNLGKIQDPAPALAWVPVTTPGVGVCQDRECQTPGSLITSGKLSEDLLNKMKLFGDSILYLSKGQGLSDKVYACFVPSSREFRNKTGILYRINISEVMPATGVLESCPSLLTWQGRDVCYYCVAE